ncbi:MAG: Stk1 family PASTA domain-containing Ser/Thr kinase [Actinobacteria bacterium]|nr:Stk1 family PASTA domain-containing Ser/Thr kinase [Actinomycetota bacterium]MDI6831622.1 Stk1 family PASTA domain-containing Ser/Thr kinase [Actinomycetota bacterium]
MLGKVFNQRYRIKEKIGSGGMADVFLADDLLLGREVAVKVLHPQYAADPSFIQRFRHEAQAAANLNHPNIVNIYDWGGEGELYYIVMEYVEGRDLKEILRTEGRLLPERAAEVAAEISAALQFAHRHNLVHRDIKPHNVFITNLGQVKVMDFGIAREGDGGGMTQTGMVMGTPQYISPEQAQGLAVDGRSDIYSLGVVLYEMLTGRVPFDDPNPVTVTYRQVREDPIPPSVIDPEIPATLEAVVMKAMAKNPANRYQTAQEMKADLLRFLEGMPVSATPVLPGRTATAALVPASGGGGSRWPWAVAAAVVAALAVTGIVLALVLGGGGGKVEVPNLQGMSLEKATGTLESLGLKVGEVKDKYIEDESEEAGLVVSQDPEWGTLLAKGEKVSLTVTRELRMPELEGMSRDAAEDILKKMGILVIEIKSTPVEDEEEVNRVLSQSPAAGKLVSPGTTVRLEIGVEQKKVAVPDVVGMKQADAEETLKKAGFLVSVSEESSSEVDEGRVIRQSPLANQKVLEGSTVTIVVSTGPSTVSVPDVRGEKEADAKRILGDAGLNYTVIYQDTSDSTQVGKVLDQVPLPGATVDAGYNVRIFVGRSS